MSTCEALKSNPHFKKLLKTCLYFRSGDIYKDAAVTKSDEKSKR